MIKDLYSVKHYGIINTNIEQLLDAIMKVKKKLKNYIYIERRIFVC